MTTPLSSLYSSPIMRRLLDNHRLLVSQTLLFCAGLVYGMNTLPVYLDPRRNYMPPVGSIIASLLVEAFLVAVMILVASVNMHYRAWKAQRESREAAKFLKAMPLVPLIPLQRFIIRNSIITLIVLLLILALVVSQVLFVIVLGFLGVIGLALSGNASNMPAYQLLEQAKAASLRADHNWAVQQCDQAMKLLPNWETYSASAVAYGFAGRIDESENLACLALAELFASPDKSGKVKAMIGTMFVTLATHAMNTRRYQRASQALAQAVRFAPDDPELYNNFAELTLRQGGSSQDALADLEQAVRLYAKRSQQPTVAHWLLRAWVEAHQGEDINPILDALEKKAEGLSTLTKAQYYLYLGRVMLAQNRPNAARHAFETAHFIDLNGFTGKLAGDQLAHLSS